MTLARLVDVASPGPRGHHGPPEAIVIVLHGGAQRPGRAAVSPTQLSVIRMIPVARRIDRAGRAAGRRFAVHRLLNSARGWDTEHTPVQDATWAIGELRERHGDLPVALVGHSLGARAALVAGADPAVRTVVALNPWVYPSDDVDLTGRRVLFVHGTDDRIARPERSHEVADRIGRRTEVTFVDVAGGKHAMLRHHDRFERAAADFVVATLPAD